MKFTKLTSAALAGATLLSLVAPAATFAATPNDDATLNGGQAVKDQTGDTTLGISFGDDGETGNMGDLRLKSVPSILDFGNHTNIAAPSFDANGKTAGSNSSNDTFAGYKRGSNQTSKNSDGKVYVQVVDEQANRVFADDGSGKSVDQNGNQKTDGTYDDQPGSWKLQVKSNGLMANGTNKITAGNLSFVGGKAAMTDGDTAKADGSFLAAGTTPTTITPTVVVPLSDDGSAAPATVIEAKAGEGAGTTTETWDPTNVKLALPKNEAVATGEYTSTITWSLTSAL